MQEALLTEARDWGRTRRAGAEVAERAADDRQRLPRAPGAEGEARPLPTNAEQETAEAAPPPPVEDAEKAALLLPGTEVAAGERGGRRAEASRSARPHGLLFLKLCCVSVFLRCALHSGAGVQELPHNSWTLKGAVYVHPPQETQRLLTLFSRFVSAAAAEGASSSQRGGRGRGRGGAGEEGSERVGYYRERRERGGGDRSERRKESLKEAAVSAASENEGDLGDEGRRAFYAREGRRRDSTGADALEEGPASSRTRSGGGGASLRGALLQPACAALLLTSLPNLKAAVVQRLLTLHIRHWTGLRCPVFVSKQ